MIKFNKLSSSKTLTASLRAFRALKDAANNKAANQTRKNNMKKKYLKAIWSGMVSGITVALMMLVILGIIGMADGPNADIDLRHTGPVAGVMGLVCGAIIGFMNLGFAREGKTDFIKITPISVVDLMLGG